jgi:hypothetical protein
MNAQADGRPIRVGVFDTTGQAGEAVDGLLAAGFTRDQISVICSDEVKEEFFEDFPHPKLPEERLPVAVATGATIGAAAGGLTTLGLVTAAGVAIAAPGPLLLAWGAVAGGFIGAMMTRGVTKEIADYYDQAVTHGRILVSVEDHEQGHPKLEAAEKIFAKAGSEPVPLEEA